MKKESAKKPSAKKSEDTSPAKKTATKTGVAKAPAKSAQAKVIAAVKGTGETLKSVAAKVAEKIPAPARVKTPQTPATIVVHYDAGWGNSLHLRGEGPGLSWTVGKPLCCVQSGEWVWVAPAVGTVVFKVLHNDQSWSLGENLVAGPGETITVNPIF